MFHKTTDELLHELTKAEKPEDFLRGNAGEMLSSSLALELTRLLTVHETTKSKVVQRSGLNRTYGYQIFMGDRFPSRDKLLALTFGIRLTLAETAMILKLAGYRELYAREPRDAILIHAIEYGSSLIDVNEALFHRGLALIG